MSELAPGLQARPSRHPASRELPAASTLLIGVTLASILGWGLLMRHFGAAIYRVLGPFALTVLLGIAVLTRKQLRVWFRPTRVSVGSWLAVGVGMTRTDLDSDRDPAAPVYPG
jgi:hypothetical protein